jgi:hypothetical protein
MPRTFSPLEKNILRSKGLTGEALEELGAAGIRSRADLATLGDAATLAALVPAVDPAVAAAVIAWATGGQPPAGRGAGADPRVVESDAVVYCVHCRTRQPTDYTPGDLCGGCGKQAEPIRSCYWCAASGPGRYCRQCGAAFVVPAELELAVLLKREGLAKDDIPARLASLSAGEKDALRGRVRRSRG